MNPLAPTNEERQSVPQHSHRSNVPGIKRREFCAYIALAMTGSSVSFGDEPEKKVSLLDKNGMIQLPKKLVPMLNEEQLRRIAANTARNTKTIEAERFVMMVGEKPARDMHAQMVYFSDKKMFDFSLALGEIHGNGEAIFKADKEEAAKWILRAWKQAQTEGQMRKVRDLVEKLNKPKKSGKIE